MTKYIKLDFGKYQNLTLEAVGKIDFQYLNYLIKNSKNINIINKCKQIVERIESREQSDDREYFDPLWD